MAKKKHRLHIRDDHRGIHYAGGVGLYKWNSFECCWQYQPGSESCESEMESGLC